MLTKLARCVQTSAIVVFEKAATRQKVLAAAEGKQLVQLRLQEPEHAYGLKGGHTILSAHYQGACAALTTLGLHDKVIFP